MQVLCILFVAALPHVNAITQESTLMRRALQVEEDARDAKRLSGSEAIRRPALLLDRNGQPIQTKYWIGDEKIHGNVVTTNVTQKVIVKVTTDVLKVNHSEEKFTGQHPLDWYLRSNGTDETNKSNSNSSNVTDMAKMTTNSTAGDNGTASNMTDDDNWYPVPKTGPGKSGGWVPMPKTSKSGDWVPMPKTKPSTETKTNTTGDTNETSTDNTTSKDDDWFKTKNHTSENGDHDDWFKTKNRSSSDHRGFGNDHNETSGTSNRTASDSRSPQNPKEANDQNTSAEASSSNSYWGNWSMPGGNWSMPKFNFDLGWHRRRRSSNESTEWPSWHINFSSHKWNWQTSSDDTSESSSDDGGSTVYPVPSPIPTPSPTTTLPLDRAFSVGDD